MRELTKSIASYGWAMSLFGLRQAAALFIPGSNVSRSLDDIARRAGDELGPFTSLVFQAGDSLQRSFVDLTFTVFTFGLVSPFWRWDRSGAVQQSTADAARAAGDVTARAMGWGIGVMQQGVNAASQALGGGDDRSRSSGGWGPVPPPDGGRTTVRRGCCG